MGVNVNVMRVRIVGTPGEIQAMGTALGQAMEAINWKVIEYSRVYPHVSDLEGPMARMYLTAIQDKEVGDGR